MDNDQRFRVCVWALVSIVIIAFISSMVFRDITIDRIAAEMVSGGTKPIEVRCLLDIGVRNDVICVAIDRANQN